MPVACVYCGLDHDTAAQVRQCWADQEEPSVAPSPPMEFVALETVPPAAVDAKAGRHRPSAAAGPGPDPLGRHVVVAPGAVPAAPWASARRVAVTADALAAPEPALGRLRAAHQARERLVIDLAVDFEQPPAQSTSAEPHELGPEFAFDLDELHHLVWTNTVDHRHPDHPTWSALDTAVAAGAEPVTDGIGDVELPDGTRAWIDAGPVRHTDPIEGVAVLHIVAIETGSLQPLGPNVSQADLSPDQLAAVTHPGGAARIIAPAGSGKTRVLTERARHLLTNWGLPPGAVSLVAFNKRAQVEMTERTADLPALQVRTLNAIALAIVNGTPPFAPQPRRWNTIDELEVRRIIGRLVNFPRRRNSDPIAPWIEALGLIRLGLASPTEVESRYDGEVDGLAQVWPNYRDALERAGAVDFDDQIHRALLVLLTQPEARRAAQRVSRVLLVDEFQDLTPAHVLLLRLLASPGGAVFGVGDDDQTIYGYNGADPGWLIDFAQLFPGAGAHPLEVNYRCPAGVVDVVDRLLRHNRRRVPKTIRAATSSPQSPGWKVDGRTDPVQATVDAVTAALAAGAAPAEIAVLARVNAVLAPVQAALVGAAIPVAGGVGTEFTQRTAVQSVLSWIRLATAGTGGPSRFAPDDLREALRRPSRSFHPRINDWICEQGSIDDLRRLAGRLNTDKDTDRLTEFATDIEGLQRLAARGAPTADMVGTLIDQIGLARAVSTLDAHRHGMNRTAQSDDLTAIHQLAALHDDPATFGTWLRTQLAIPRTPHGVVLATVHRVKGQEWPHVIVHLADTDQYPHRLSEDTEEERRLFHVALTRAGNTATITTGPNPSPFISELTTEPNGTSLVTSRRAPPTAAKKTTGGAQPRPKPTPDSDLTASERALYGSLCELRHDLRDGKPAYVVYDNKTAAALARSAPTTRVELLRVPGIGPAKADAYGDAILAAIRRHTS